MSEQSPVSDSKGEKTRLQPLYILHNYRSQICLFVLNHKALIVHKETHAKVIYRFTKASILQTTIIKFSVFKNGIIAAGQINRVTSKPFTSF